MLICATFDKGMVTTAKIISVMRNCVNILITQQGILLTIIFCFSQPRLEVGYSNHVMAELRIPEEGSKARKRGP